MSKIDRAQLRKNFKTAIGLERDRKVQRRLHKLQHRMSQPGFGGVDAVLAFLDVALSVRPPREAAAKR